MSECVYFMRAFFRSKIHKQNIGFVHWKIGRTFNAERRRPTFQTACPVPMELIGTIACASRSQSAALERELHQYFADCRLQGEWFALDSWHTRAVWSLIKHWTPASTMSASDYLRSLPKKLEADDLPQIKVELVPLAALHQARAEIKKLREQLRASEQRAHETVEKAKNAVDYLTSKYASVIQRVNSAPH